MIGRHSVMESPESVTRVAPPTHDHGEHEDDHQAQP
jgi:hypothetical protein